MKAHLMRMHGNKKYHCLKCGKEFYNKHVLKQHLKRLHSDKKKSFCQECNKSFNHNLYWILIDDTHMVIYKLLLLITLI